MMTKQLRQSIPGIALLLLFGLPLCNGQDVPKNETAKKSKAAIRAVLDQTAVAWNKGDLVAFMEGYHRSPDIRFVANNSVTYGWKNTLKRYQESNKTKADMGTLVFSELDIQMLAPDVAMVYGRFTNKMDGKQEDPTGLFTLIFKKTDNGWRIIHDHSSDAMERKKD